MNDKGLRSLIYKKLLQINKNDNYLLNVFCALKFYVYDLVQTSLKKKKKQGTGYRLENWELKTLIKLPRVTEIVSCGLESKPRSIRLQSSLS